MSRYSLVPMLTKDTKSKTEKFSLIPTEGFNSQIKEIDLPLNIVPKQKTRTISRRRVLKNLFKH